MVVIINSTSNLSRVLTYNEKKVAQGKAELLEAKNFLQNKNNLTYDEKFQRFQNRNELNTRSAVNTLHISVNFQPGENIANQTLVEIADRYMQGIKLENQPYLVYRHDDAEHPHIHIVTTLIHPDGHRARTQMMGKELSASTRKVIEQEFNLQPAGILHHPAAKKEVYSDQLNSEAKESIGQTLETVILQYRFTNLTEYNAILRLHKIMADTGRPGSQTQKHGGLLYRQLDEQGNKIGKPIKASQFPAKPTLAHLQEKFEEGKEHRQQDITSLRQKINWAQIQNPSSLPDQVTDLQKVGVEIALHSDPAGAISLTYIDKIAKTAVLDELLGQGYNPDSKLQILAAKINSSIPQLLSQIIQSRPSSGSSSQDLDIGQGLRP